MAKPKPIVMPVVISDEGMVFALDPGANKRLRAQFVAAVKSWPHGPAELELRPFASSRSARANRYYWGVVLKMMAAESGHTADELHEVEKMRHLSSVVEVVNPETGEVEEMRIPGSTAKLTISEFSDYLERVMADGAQMCGIVFPEPSAGEEWRDQAKVPA